MNCRKKAKWFLVSYLYFKKPSNGIILMRHLIENAQAWVNQSSATSRTVILN